MSVDVQGFDPETSRKQSERAESLGVPIF